MWYLVWCPVGPATSLLVSLQTQTHAGADAATYAPSTAANSDSRLY